MRGQRVSGSRAVGWHGRGAAVAMLLVLSTIARSGFSQSDSERATARRLANAGVEAYQQQDYRVAVEKLEKAFEILKAPWVALWLARALSQRGQLVAAAERFAEAGRLPIDRGNAGVQAAAQRDAAAELEALTPQILLLVIQVPGATASELALAA
jgi:tetratricopeptide (TPR) repeat protein